MNPMGYSMKVYHYMTPYHHPLRPANNMALMLWNFGILAQQGMGKKNLVKKYP